MAQSTVEIAMVMVYAHRIKDGNTSQMVIAPHKRTEAAIKFLDGEIIPATGEEVPDAAVDGEGRYNPKTK
jgi:hypothetical protein